MTYEYKVVPAPLRGTKAPGVKTNEDRFALSLENAMNELAADGWEYIRADTLPCEQREGLMSKTTVYQNMLVFRRAKVVNTAPKMKAQRPVPAAPSVTPPAEKVQKKVVLSDDKPAPDAAAND
ncbi:DUF4177 domain-containing protein [Yoonia vestfoldensis]|uniref:DUF4177 domain-containing protein n=1 Tax=Yoonia vestfoldensis TaxID=245188 RepID=UPI0003A3D746|nr:DUF4177 domain-containing protein [Yoonia vestfoldensis]